MLRTSSSTMLQDVRRAMFRHRKKAFFAFLLAVGSASTAAFLLPKTYRSEGQLFVRLGRENATLDTTTTPGQESVVALPMSRENEINSLVEVLRSRVMLEKVVDARGPDEILGPWRESAVPTAAGSEEEAGRREQAILCLKRRLSIVPARRSSVIGIECEGPSPGWARDVVSQFIELYLAEHIRLNRPQGSLEFFAEQMERLQRNLSQKEQALCDLKSATGIVSLADQRTAIVERITGLQNELARAQTDLAVSDAKVEQLRDQLVGLPETEVTSRTTGHANHGTDLMREELYRLDLQREQWAATYNEEHPLMRQIEDQLAAARQIVGHQKATRTQITTANNRLYKETRLSLLQEESTLASRRAETAMLRTQLAGARRVSQSFNENEFRIVQLERDVELAREGYRRYAASVERARIDHALEAQRMSNISVVQPATYEPEPIRPRQALILSLGLLSGVLGALGLALAAEHFDQRFHTPEDVEARLDLSVLGTVPHLRETQLTPNGNGRS